MTYLGPRRLTTKETKAILSLPAAQIRKLREGMVRSGVQLDRIQQVTNLMLQRAKYERAVPANNGRSTLDR